MSLHPVTNSIIRRLTSYIAPAIKPSFIQTALNFMKKSWTEMLFGVQNDWARKSVTFMGSALVGMVPGKVDTRERIAGITCHSKDVVLKDKIVDGDVSVKDGHFNAYNTDINGNVSTSGCFHAHDVKVRGRVDTGSSFTATNVEIEDSVYAGSMFLANNVIVKNQVLTKWARLKLTHIMNAITVTDLLSATRSRFDGRVFVESFSANFDNCQINAPIIVTSGPQSPARKQVIYLLNNTTAHHGVVFTSGLELGEVHIDKTSKVLGQVIGGTIVHINE